MDRAIRRQGLNDEPKEVLVKAAEGLDYAAKLYKEEKNTAMDLWCMEFAEDCRIVASEK